MADICDFKRDALAACADLASVVVELNTYSPQYNALDHNMLGLSTDKHSGWILRQLRQYFASDKMELNATGPAPGPDRANYVLLYDICCERKADRPSPEITQDLYRRAQTSMSRLVDAVRGAVKLRPGIRQAALARSLGITFPDPSGQKDRFISNILSIMSEQGIVKCASGGKKTVTPLSDAQYIWREPAPVAARCQSRGEAAVASMLRQFDYTYTHQWTDRGCRDQRLLPFDFCVEHPSGYTVLVEVDGEHHRRFVPQFHRTPEGFELTQRHDAIKNRFAADNDIYLLRIVYEGGRLEFNPQQIRRLLDKPKLIQRPPVATV